jgi:hypothetical protein
MDDHLFGLLPNGGRLLWGVLPLKRDEPESTNNVCAVRRTNVTLTPLVCLRRIHSGASARRQSTSGFPHRPSGVCLGWRYSVDLRTPTLRRTQGSGFSSALWRAPLHARDRLSPASAGADRHSVPLGDALGSLCRLSRRHRDVGGVRALRREFPRKSRTYPVLAHRMGRTLQNERSLCLQKLQTATANTRLFRHR